MLPYVPAETLRRNPNFQALYTDLLKNKLHVDGSSREYVLQDRSLDQVLYLLSTKKFYQNKNFNGETMLSIIGSG